MLFPMTVDEHGKLSEITEYVITDNENRSVVALDLKITMIRG